MMLRRIVSHPLVGFVLVFAGIVLLDLIFDGRIQVEAAVFGAIGGGAGAAIGRRFRRTGPE